MSVDADTLLDNLDFAFMINGEARKGRWFVATDVIYLDLSERGQHGPERRPESGPGTYQCLRPAELDAGTSTDLKGWVWTMVGGYAAVQDPRWNLDVIGGFRLLDIRRRPTGT